MGETFLHDLRHSLRMFIQSPAFTLAAVAAVTAAFAERAMVCSGGY